MKVWIFQIPWDYDGGANVTKVFDSKEKAEKWKKRMEELTELYIKLTQDGCSDNISERNALDKEAGTNYEIGGYEGIILEREIT